MPSWARVEKEKRRREARKAKLIRLMIFEGMVDGLIGEGMKFDGLEILKAGILHFTCHRSTSSCFPKRRLAGRLSFILTSKF